MSRDSLIFRDEYAVAAADTLARTIYGEARGESHLGRVAVANVIMNRVKRPGWWGRSIPEVCQKPYQFSCWNKDDPNRQKLLLVQPTDKVFAECLEIAKRAIAGELADVTGGATHYMVKSITDKIDWDDGMVQTADIGAHVFFKEG